MRTSRRWQLGLLGIAVAGTVALVLPIQAPSASAVAPQAQAAVQPDRAVQQEATALANRVDAALRRTTSLLSTVAEGDLDVFTRERLALNAGNGQWPISLFTATPGKGSDFTMQPPGERFLDAGDVEDIQRRGPWVAERPRLRALIAAVNSPSGQILAARIPFSYFSDALDSLPRPDGVRRYLLDAQGKPLERSAAPSGEDRTWCQQLISEGEGFLATSDAFFAVARVPSTGWAVVVRHPLSGLNPSLTLEPTFMAGAAMVATSPLGGAGIPRGLVLYPLAGVALLFGLAMVGWKQRWPGMEEGPIAFGEHALRRVTGPLRDRLGKGRTEPRPPSQEGLVPFAEVPSQLPAAIAGDDVEFLRSEQVRNLRELWSHTEERLSGQRSWVREEVRKLQESASTSLGELTAIVNQTEQRMEDARAAWGDVQASLLARIDEARSGVLDEQDARRHIEDQIARQERKLGDSLESLEARVNQGLEATDARVAEQLEAIDRRLSGELASLGVKLKMELAGLGSRSDDRHGALDARLGTEIEALRTELVAAATRQEQDTTRRLGSLDERLEAMGKALREHLASAIEAEQHQREAGNEALAGKLSTLDARLAQEVAALRDRLDGRIGGLEAQLAQDLSRTDARIQEDFARLEAAIHGARAALDSLEARESADSDQTRRAIDDQTARLASLEAALARAEAALDGDLRAQSSAVRDLEHLIQGTAERFADEIASARTHADRLGEALIGFEDRVGGYRAELDERLASLEAGLRDDQTEGEARTREALAEHHLALERLKGDLDAAVAQALPRLRTEIDAVRGEVAQRVEGFVLDLSERLEALDARLMAAAEQRIVAGLDLLETAVSELRTELAAAQEGHRTDLETLMTELAAIADEALPALREEVAPVQVLNERTGALEGRLEALAPRMAAFAEQVAAMQAEAAGLAARHEGSDERHTAIEARLGSLEEALDPLGNRLASLEGALSPLQDRLGSLEGGVAPLNDRLGSVEDGIKPLGERLASIEDGIKPMSARLASVEDGLKPLDARLGSLAEDLEPLSERVESLEETIVPVSQRLASVEDLLDPIAERLGSVENGMQPLGERIASIEDGIKPLGERLASLEDGIKPLGDRLGSVEEGIKPLDDRLASVEEGIKPLSDRLASVEDGIAPLSGRLASLEDSIAPLGERLESVEDGIKQIDERWESAQGRLDSLIQEADAGLRGLGDELRREQGTLDKRLQEAEGRFLGKIEDLAARNGAIEALASQRFEQTQAAIGGLAAKVEESLKGQEGTQRLTGELGGLKGRLEGLAMAHGRQQETLNAALSQLAKLQQEVGGERRDPALEGRVDDLTGLVQQLAEQSRLLAQALDANTEAAARTESWIQAELGTMHASQGQALAALEKENATLKATLEAMRESQEALSHRMHMVVQVLSKLSK